MRGVNLFILVLAGVLGYITLQILLPFWSYSVLGLIIAYLGRGPYLRVLRHVKGRRSIAAAITLVLVLLIVITPLAWVSYTLVVQTTELVGGLNQAQVRETVEGVTSVTQERFGWPPAGENTTAVQDAIASLAPVIREQASSWLPSAVTFLGVFIAGVAVALFIGYYGLKDGDTLYAFLRDLTPLSHDRMDLFAQEIDGIVVGVFMGQVVTSLVQGFLGYLAFLMLDVPNALFWSFIMAILSFLPVVGAFLVWAPVAFVLILTGNTGAGIGLAIWGAAVISSVDNLIKPKLIAGRSQLHPALALLGVLGGLAAFGFMGFLVGPLVIALFVATLRVIREERIAAIAVTAPAPDHDEPVDPGADAE